MSDATLRQFGRDPAGDAAEERPRVSVCGECGSHFSADARFCPFDGTELRAANDYDPGEDPLLGAVIDSRYEVQRVLGEGGMGTVYLVRHQALGKRFALKALRKDLANDGEIAARFIQEARTASSVSHPGLVEITDFGRLLSGQVYFVMEYLQGQSLAALIRRGGPLPAKRGLGIVRQMAAALRAAHDAGIVHRDLKPDNVHVGVGDGDADLVKIVDFGLAKVIGSSRLTRAGMVFGTPHYMSPEQAAGDPVDHRADIYALGVVMYEMFTGRVPFEADSYMGVLTKHMYMAPVPPSQIHPAARELGALEAVILRCLQKRPQARYESLGALLSEVEGIAAGTAPAGVRRPIESPGLLADQLELPSAPPRLKRSRSWLVPLLPFVALAAGGLLLGFATLRPRSAPPVSSTRAGLESTRVELGTAENGGSQRRLTASEGGTGGGLERPAEASASAPVPGASVTAPATSVRSRTGKTARGTPSREPRARDPGSAPSRAPRAGDGEIVDPWQR